MSDYYLVGADGKAPANLPTGSNVVTYGGTYQIESVGADGKYTSKKVSDVTPDTFTGSYATPPGGSSYAPGSNNVSSKSSGSNAPELGDYVDDTRVNTEAYLTAWRDAMLQSNENTAKQIQEQLAAMRERANSEYDDAQRGAYIANQLALRDASKAMANAGLGTQGYTETTLANQGRDYQNALNDILKQRQNTMLDYDLQESQAVTDYYNTLNEIAAQMALQQMQAAQYDNETAYSRGMDAYTADYNTFRDDRDYELAIADLLERQKQNAITNDFTQKQIDLNKYQYDTTRKDDNYWKGVEQENWTYDQLINVLQFIVGQQNTERELAQGDKSLAIQAAKAGGSNNGYIGSGNGGVGYEPYDPEFSNLVDTAIKALFPSGTNLPKVGLLEQLDVNERRVAKELGIAESDGLLSDSMIDAIYAKLGITEADEMNYINSLAITSNGASRSAFGTYYGV